MRYDADKERYFEKVNGRDEVVPRVSALIRWAGLCDPRKYTPGSAERGRLIHTLCDEYDKTGEIPEHESKVAGYSAFLNEYEIKILDTEKIIGSYELGYAGRCDRYADTDSGLMVIDIKSGHPEPWHHHQVVAYAYALGIDNAAILYLLDSGRYRFVQVAEDEFVKLRDEWLDIVRRYHEEATPWD